MAITDRLSIKLGGDELQLCAGYSVEIGMMTQPSVFAVRLGHRDWVQTILNKYPPNTPCEIRVTTATGNPLQFKGTIDARRAVGPNATVEIHGRDALSQLWGSYATADRSYVGMTYLQLVQAVLKDSGLPNATIDTSFANDVQAKTGSAKVPYTRHVQVTGFAKRIAKVVQHPPQIRVGERNYEFLKRILDRAGMFLMAKADGNILLCEPDAQGQSLYRISNSRRTTVGGDPVVPGTVISYDFNDDTTRRYTRADVYGRGNRAKFGLTKGKSHYIDDEMVAWGFNRPRGFMDSNVSTTGEADLFARCAIATSRRNGRFLSYTLAGHTTKSIISSETLVWSRMTMVDVQDDELGFHGPHFIEHVSLVGTETETHTVVRLMRPNDLVFGDADT